MIAAIRDRLDAQKDALGLKLVSSAASFAAAYETTPTAMPAVYVVPAEDIPGENGLGGGRAIAQRVRRVAGVVIAVSNVADAQGAAASDDLEPLRIAIQGALYGWSPGAGYDPLELAPSRMLPMRNGVLWWQEGYRSNITKRSIP